jgi:protein TonB
MRLRRQANRVSVVATVAIHAILIVAALGARPIVTAIAEATPLTVSLVPSSARPEPAPRVPPPKPVLAEPASIAVPLPVIALAPAADAASVPAATRLSSASVAAPSSLPAPAAPPVIAPVFDADYLQNPAPAYPRISRHLNEEGRVLLRVWVRSDGSAERVEIARSSGFERLDRSAREAVARWRFLPARQGEQAVASSVLVPVAFVLKG